MVNHYGLIVAWDYAAANVADNAFGALVADFADEMVVFTDMAFHTHGGDPPNQKLNTAWYSKKPRGLSYARRRSAEPKSVQARHVEGPPGGGGGAVAVDAGRWA